MDTIQYTSREALPLIMQGAYEAYLQYAQTTRKERAALLSQIKENMQEQQQELIETAMKETNLQEARLKSEFTRTLNQLQFFSDMLLEGSYLDISIDTAIPERMPAPKPDIRKMMLPLGPVVVFGAGNFPFAYSTMGGDSASALAAGCSVIVKAHPAHPLTSEKVAVCVRKAVGKMGMPENVFTHLHFSDVSLGKDLVTNDYAAAVGFTGSLQGGRALYDYAAQRDKPIPVFAEMGSTNPVLLLPGYLHANIPHLVKIFTASITGSMGQFCTKPGIFLGMASDALEKFAYQLAESLNNVLPERMLYSNIRENFNRNRSRALNISGVHKLTKDFENAEAEPTVAFTTGEHFRKHSELRHEVFGPFSIVISCRDKNEMIEIWKSISGQLTTSIFGTNDDFSANPELPAMATHIAGRVIFNGVPTGVEVCPSMVHGGPYPATTDGRFTAVGIQSVKRWLRPVCFQNAPQSVLPPELRNQNPERLRRLVNNQWTTEDVP
jgi:alpha-ketoglutaric semialdehyde dehydrogenase